MTIGFYHLVQPCPQVMEGTDFAPHKEIFMGAWQRIERAIQKAGSMGIGVLVGTSSAGHTVTVS